MRGFEGRIFIPALVALLKGYRLMRGSTSGISSWAFPQVLTKNLAHRDRALYQHS